MRIVQKLNEDAWSAFVEQNTCGNIFHTPAMFEVFSQAEDHYPSLWAAVEGEDQILALLLPVEIVLYSQLRRFSSRAVVYGGVLSDPSPEGREGLSHLLEHYKRETRGRNLFTELRNISDTLDIQPILCENNFFYEDHLNYLIDLDRTPEGVMNSISTRTRKHIRRGLRKGALTVQVASNPDQLDDCYDLFNKSYRMAQIPIAPKSLFEAAFNVLSPREMAQFLLAYVDDVPVAASIELLYKDVIYGWYSGMDRAYSSYTPNELLMWHILSWGAENGYRQYDFGGAGKPDEDYGVRHFKAKFGGKLVNFGRNKYVSSPLILKFSEVGYDVARRLLFS